MELCTNQAVLNLPISSHRQSHTLFTAIPNLHFKTSLRFRQPLVLRSDCRSHFPRVLRLTGLIPRATPEGTSTGPNQFAGEERDGVVTLDDVPPVEKTVNSESVPTEAPKEEALATEDTQTYEFLEKLNVKFDSEDTYSLLLYGSGALFVLWLAVSVVGAIEAIPLFPKLMEFVGLGYSFWFVSRYLLFKKNRDELGAKIEELKEEVLGTNDD